MKPTQLYYDNWELSITYYLSAVKRGWFLTDGIFVTLKVNDDEDDDDQRGFEFCCSYEHKQNQLDLVKSLTRCRDTANITTIH